MQTTKTRQTGIGLALAALVFAAWAVIHIWAMFALRLENWTWLLVPVIFATQCWLSVGMFIVAHDAMHGSLSPKFPRLGEAVGAAMLFLYAGFAWHRMRSAHFEHHRHSGSAGDPDFNAANPRAFWPWYFVFLKRYFGWMSMAWVGGVTLVYYYVLDVPYANLVLLYGLPSIASSFQLFYFGTYLPHRHECASAAGQRVCADQFRDRHRSRTNDYGPVASLLSCFHFGYHHEHHLSPALPWWALPARHKTYIEEQSL